MKIAFGAFAKPLHKQLDVPPSQLQTVQKNIDAYTRLRVHGLITDGEAPKIVKRIMKQIERALQK